MRELAKCKIATAVGGCVGECKVGWSGRVALLEGAAAAMQSVAPHWATITTLAGEYNAEKREGLSSQPTASGSELKTRPPRGL